jgi:hypothetical protein
LLLLPPPSANLNLSALQLEILLRIVVVVLAFCKITVAAAAAAAGDSFHHQSGSNNNNNSKLKFQIWQVNYVSHPSASFTVSAYSSSFCVLFRLPDSFFLFNFKLEIPNKDITLQLQ